MNWGMCPSARSLGSPRFWDEEEAEDMQAFQRMSHMVLRIETSVTINTEIRMADRLHIICTTLDGLARIKEAE